jgi:prevent-host-death family protein
MAVVNIHEAKTHLSRLVDEVSAGKELVIAKAGKPLARLVPIKPPKPVRKPGFLKGKIRISSDFDEPLPDKVLDAFEGRT